MVSINSLNFNESIVKGWHVADATENGRGWADSSNPARASMTLTIDFDPQAPIVPADSVSGNLVKIRQECKERVNSRGACLLEHEFASNDTLKMIRVLEKIPMQPHGMAYQGSLYMLDDASVFLVQLLCLEAGVTGIRDALILNEFMAAGTFNPELEDWGGWMIDPHGFGKQTPLMYNISEDAKYDATFPDHPLSKVRAYLPRIMSSLTFDPTLEYFGPPEPPKKTSWFQDLFGKR